MTEQDHQLFSENGNGHRSIFLDEGETALRPARGREGEVYSYLRGSTLRWRTDPVFQCVIVPDPKSVRLLSEKFDVADETQNMRRFLDRADGVRVVACNPLDALLLYKLPEDMIYKVDANSYVATPLPFVELAYRFSDVGRTCRMDDRMEFDSLAEAVQIFKTESMEQQASWLSTNERVLAELDPNDAIEDERPLEGSQ